MFAACLLSLLVAAPALADRSDDEWSGPPKYVLYLPALDVEAGGGFAPDAGGWGLLGRVSTGVHRMTSLGVLTLGPQGARETGRWVMGMGAEWLHLRSGFGLDLAALRDLTEERWGVRAAIAASYLRFGISLYEGSHLAYIASIRVPLALFTAWTFGWL